MRYLLDTNVCVDYLTGRHPAVVARVQRTARATSASAYGRVSQSLEPPDWAE